MLEQTLYAEYPELKPYLLKLEREKTNQTPQSLAEIWGVDGVQAVAIADQLVDVGFFQRRGPKDQPMYWVPFLYRPALALIQGSADAVYPRPALPGALCVIVETDGHPCRRPRRIRTRPGRRCFGSGTASPGTTATPPAHGYGQESGSLTG